MDKGQSFGEWTSSRWNSARLARKEQEFLVAFHSGDRRRDSLDDAPAKCGDEGRDLIDGQLVRRWIAHDASLADILTPRLKLRLNENDCFTQVRSGRQNRLEQQCCRDEGN